MSLLLLIRKLFRSSFAKRTVVKLKNAKILSWRLELSQLHYDIRHKPGVHNVAHDALPRSGALAPCIPLRQLHESLGHPGYDDFTALFGT